ncbi:MAG TPA: PVC-type heme-binding CxxCH protein [Gemmatimonadaceae bacterium]|nr:PVC-type heme-binding CxxCH protein [Gemmatimonadaceae bacterium]
MRLLHALAALSVIALVSGRVRSERDQRAPGAAPDSSWRSPEAERAALHVPAGFEVQLVASEPDIDKPMNLAFDARGRLWVTHSREYPIAAARGAGRDRVSILEDTSGDGRADRFTTFADSLNIPIGIEPMRDGAIVFSIPNLYRMIDRDGDGRADERRVLYGPFDFDDTHGMVNSLLRSYDGWIHAGHGFSNRSTVAGTDGDSIRMTSGNTFRFRDDGTRVEQLTWGRVNPFGMFVDRFGYFYSSDSHTKPVYQPIRGAEYPHFGRLPSGIGWGPQMMEHLHGSTAIAGVVLYEANQFPVEYRDNFFGGNVVTNRINRNALRWHGSSPEAVEQPDFVVSEDPNFRPVDVELGPDGALYIADFYNPIIGHYEFPLDDPRRDRRSGRIWRIVYTGRDGGTAARIPRRDWTRAGTQELIGDLAHANVKVRLLATNELADRGGPGVITAVRRLIDRRSPTAEQKASGLWILSRLGALPPERLRAAAHDHDELVRVHALRIMAEARSLSEGDRATAEQGLRDASPHVRRIAVEVLGRHPAWSAVRPLLDLRAAVPAEDTHLLYTVRVAVRDHLRDPAIFDRVRATDWSESDSRAIADAASGISTAGAARLLLAHLQRVSEPRDQMVHYLRHVARYAPAAETEPLAGLVQRAVPSDLDLQIDLHEVARAGIAERGEGAPPAMRAWSEALVAHYLDSAYGAGLKANEVTLRRQQAARIAGDLRLQSAEPHLLALFADTKSEPAARVAAGRALLAIDRERHVALVGGTLIDPAAPAPMREELVGALAAAAPEGLPPLARALDMPSARLRERITYALAGSAVGAQLLVDAVRAGRLPGQALADATLRERLVTGKPDAIRTAVAELARSDSALEAARLSRVDAITRRFDVRVASAERGSRVFAANCTACHSARGQGGQVGPQLDGVGHRAPADLLAKVLRPNRNVAPAFRYETVLLKNGDVFTGLYRREQGVSLAFADRDGKEVSVPKSQIAERRITPYTLMPSNFMEVISERDLHDLVAYLGTLR